MRGKPALRVGEKAGDGLPFQCEGFYSPGITCMCHFSRLVLASLVLFGWLASPAMAENPVVRVGIYENSPKVFTSDAGRPAGIFIDVIEHIARQEGWQIQYVHGSWKECLGLLEKGEIDLLPDVAYTSERDKIFSFHRIPVLSSWFQVYARKGSGIRSILDLNGKKVAVLDGSVQQETFRALAGGYGVQVSLISAPDYRSVFEAVVESHADAAISNQFFGNMNATRFGLEDTAVIFTPSNLFFAAPRGGSRKWMDAIDARLRELKNDSQSIYYRSLRRWTSEEVHFKLPPWLQTLGLIAGVALLISLGNAWYWRRQLKIRTRELRAHNQVVSAMTGSLNLVEMVEHVLDEALNLVEVEEGAICLVTPDGTLEVTARRPNFEAPLPDPGADQTPVAHCPCDKCVHLCTPLILRTREEILECAGGESSHAGGITFHAAFPLTTGGTRVGVLCVFTRTDREPPDRRLRLLETLCSQVAMGIENARLYSKIQLHAAEMEQRVLARTEQLAARNQELKDFAYTVSHDLKAPLRGIAGYAGELNRKHRAGLGDRALFCLAQILTATSNLDHLIEDLLHYSRLDSETPILTEVNPRRLVDALLQDRELIVAEQGLVVTVDISPTPLRAWERGLVQVLANLIDNAIKYSRKACPPRLRITAATVDGAWRLSVSDNGIGFDMKYHDRIFGLFNRLVRMEEFEGTGAGLAIVRKVLDKQGGRIWAESAPGQGATFFVELPGDGGPAGHGGTH